MPSDKELYLHHKVNGESYQDIADAFNLNVDSVRSRINRVPLSVQVQAAQKLSTLRPLKSPAVLRQEAVVDRCQYIFSAMQETLKARGRPFYAVFISDLHIPNTNWAAVELATQLIIACQPAYISAMNDLFDFQGYSNWGDNRTAAERLWSSDLETAYAVTRHLYDLWRKAAPDSMLLQVQGNHDNWLFNYLRNKVAEGIGERVIADFMEEMETQGVKMLSRHGQNVVKISPGLKWLHGISAAKNMSTVAKNTLQAMRGEGDEAGIWYNTVAGHTHRALNGYQHGGVRHWNSGTMMQYSSDLTTTGTGLLITADGNQSLEFPTYLKNKPHWDTGIVINLVDPNSRQVGGWYIDFYREGDALCAIWEGNKYKVQL